MAMRALLATGVRSVLLTSGTLSPLASFAAELQVPFRVQLENPHVIAPQQARLAGTNCESNALLSLVSISVAHELSAPCNVGCAGSSMSRMLAGVHSEDLCRLPCTAMSHAIRVETA